MFYWTKSYGPDFAQSTIEGDHERYLKTRLNEQRESDKARLE